jgi:hypothetical protein
VGLVDGGLAGDGVGTLVLALAPFVAVRAANRAARTAEYSMQSGIRPLLMSSRLTDTEQKIMWATSTGCGSPARGRSPRWSTTTSTSRCRSATRVRVSR